MNLNIAGAVVHYKQLITNLAILKVHNKDIHFTVYDGPNMCHWNGGRINRDITLEPNMVELYNKLGISVALTFSNPNINVMDEVGNHLLEMLDHYGSLYNVKNKIILVNDNLRQYIRSKYNFTLVYSITGHPSDITITDELIRRYKDLETKFDIVVPKFEVVFEEEWYSNINPSKYELLVNDTCGYGCKRFLEHFQAVAEFNRISDNPWEEIGFHHCHNTEECYIEGFNPDKGSPEDREKYGDKLGMDYTKEMLHRAKSLGFTSFKLSGRENSADRVVSELKQFLKDIR